MSKIKILFIPYTMTNGGGAEKVLSLLVNNLDSSKYDIRIQEVHRFKNMIQLNQNIKMGKPFFDDGILLQQKIFRRIKLALLCHAPWILKSLFRLYSYDVVISFNYQLPSFMLPAFKKEKKIAWFHGDIFDLAEKGKIKVKEKQRKVWKTADAIVTISNKSLHSLEVLFPEFMNKARIIHNGINLENARKLSKEKCDFDFGAIPTLICAGRLDENKNFALVIEAVSVLKKRSINCQLILLGEGEKEAELKKQVEALGLSDRIFFLGYQTNPYSYIACSKVMCISSFSEGWPMVTMEAMALGIPFVTTKVSGASEELSDNGKCGLVSDWNAEEYADKLQKLLTDSELYEQMSKNCKEKAKEYSVEKYVAAFEKLLSDVGAGK